MTKPRTYDLRKGPIVAVPFEGSMDDMERILTHAEAEKVSQAGTTYQLAHDKLTNLARVMTRRPSTSPRYGRATMRRSRSNR
jgi:hypothetical protein